MSGQHTAWRFRVPMAVTQLRWFRTDGTYPVCPQCGISLEREYQRFCDRCGQRLGWKNYERAKVIYPQKERGHRWEELRKEVPPKTFVKPAESD